MIRKIVNILRYVFVRHRKYQFARQGKKVIIGNGCIINSASMIEFGDNVSIGPNAVLYAIYKKIIFGNFRKRKNRCWALIISLLSASDQRGFLLNFCRSRYYTCSGFSFFACALRLVLKIPPIFPVSLDDNDFQPPFCTFSNNPSSSAISYFIRSLSSNWLKSIDTPFCYSFVVTASF